MLQEELERKSRQASSQLDGDMKSLQRDLTDKTKVCVYLSRHSFMQRPVHPSFGPPVIFWGEMSSTTIGIVSYALKLSVNGITCVCVSK